MTPRNNRDVNTRSKIKGKVSKLLVSTALLGPVVLPPIVASEWLNPHEASAASVADIDVLTQTNVNATLNEPAEGEDYRLQLNVNTGSVAGLDVVGTNQRVIVHSDDLAGLWYPIEGETATVTVQILPITMDNLPVVDGLLRGTLGTTTSLINEILGLVDGTLGTLLDIVNAIPFGP
jgi:hypothetical protein